MAVKMDEGDLGRLALHLQAASPAEWTQRELRNVVAGLGWVWADTSEGPFIRTGLPAGDASLRPVGKFEQPYSARRDFVSITIPVAVSDAPAAAKADDFRQAADALTRILGPSHIMGTHGDIGPFFDATPLWGSPFRRWYDRQNIIELRASDEGTELVLQPSVPVEDWHWRQGHGEPFALGGFFGVTKQAEPELVGMGIPGMWKTDDWDVFGNALGNMLRTLPAETRALGIQLSFGMHGMLPGTGGPWVFSLACADELELGIFADLEARPAGGFELLGWTPVADRAPSDLHLDDVAFHSGSFGPGQADGPGLARMLVETAIALGIESPKRGLSLTDHAQSVDDYRVDYYGLTLSENP